MEEKGWHFRWFAAVPRQRVAASCIVALPLRLSRY
ncbi:hypothetical protein N172_04690 [Pantoea dispersa EGD-AAK13]|nr:hypothetical protein N172_04690 [Pantoea dispersa EGD-AAK13]